MLVFFLMFLVSTAVLAGIRARYQRGRFLKAAALAATRAGKTEVGASIPQDPAALAKRRHDLLAWNRRTLGEAYDRVGKKDPRWDEQAREALDLAARMFSGEVDPQVTFDDIYQAARAALEAGCDDPMVAYVYARTSVGANDPGAEEEFRRIQSAAKELAASRYPAMRRAVALAVSGSTALSSENPSESNRKEAQRHFDDALALLEESVTHDERNQHWQANWLDTLVAVTRGYRTLGVPAEAAYERVDGRLGRVANAKVLRLIYRGNFWFDYGWEARTRSFASAVPKGGFETLGTRLEIAQEAFQEAWKLQPGSGEAAQRLLEIDKAVGGDRANMELWFDRAMKANGDNRTVCWSKLDWLDPKWHGSVEDMLAFGRACRDTKNSRTGITLLVAEAHWRIACLLGSENQTKYLALPEVWADIQPVFEEYLKHQPADDIARSRFAMYCYLSGHYREAEVQYVTLGDRLTQWSESPYVPLDQLKRNRAHNATIVASYASSEAFPGWHFVAGKSQGGKWKVNVPVGVTPSTRPGIFGPDTTRVWTCAADGVTYQVCALRLPGTLRNHRPEHILEAARSVVAEARGLQPRDLHDTLLGARPAQEYELDLSGPEPKQQRIKTAVIGSWLYELSVTGTKVDVAGPAACEFFDSFAFQSRTKL